eukprot:1215535-Prorocentrum_lima.AAC.1
MKGTKEINDVRRDEGAGKEGAPVRELMREEVDSVRGEPLRSQLESQVFQGKRTAKEEGAGGVGERRGDVHKKEPPGVGAKITAVHPDAGGEQRLS